MIVLISTVDELTKTQQKFRKGCVNTITDCININVTKVSL